MCYINDPLISTVTALSQVQVFATTNKNVLFSHELQEEQHQSLPVILKDTMLVMRLESNLAHNSSYRIITAHMQLSNLHFDDQATQKLSTLTGLSTAVHTVTPDGPSMAS